MNILKTNKFLNSSLQTFVIRIVGISLQFFATMLLTNNVLESTVGQFNYVLFVIVILGSLNLLGLNTSFFQFSGRLKVDDNLSHLPILYKKSIVLVTLCYTIITLLYVVATYVLSLNWFVSNKNILIYAVIGVYPFSIMILNFQAIRAFDKLFASEIFRSLFRFGLLLALITAIILFNIEKQLLLYYVIMLFIIAVTTTLYILFLANKESIIGQENKNLK